MTVARLSRTCAALAVGATLVGGAATAASAHPTSAVKPFSTNLIVVQQSIGGIRIGESATAVRTHFPATGCNSYQCTYHGAGYTVQADLDVLKQGGPKVVSRIDIYNSRPGTAATKVRTGSGIGIGSPVATVRKKFPKSHGNAKTGPFFFGSGKPNTVLTFFALGKNDYVDQVSIALQLGH